jgi:hypothetical protein
MSLQQNLRSGYAALGSAASASGLTDTGAAWLVKTFDPNHDAPVANHGLPDKCEAKTIVRELKGAAVISPETFGLNVGPSETWNFHCNFLPLTGPWQVQGAYINADQIVERSLTSTASGPAAAQQTFHPIQLAGFVGDGRTNATGQCWPKKTSDIGFTFSDLPGVKAYRGFDLPFVAADRQPLRVIGAAFELIDISPVLNKAGSVTTYRVNSEFDLERYQTVVTNLVAAPASPAYNYGGNDLKNLRNISLPINDQEAMMNLPGTVQWEAERGAYCVAAMDPSELHGFPYLHDCTPLVGLNQISNEQHNGCITANTTLVGKRDNETGEVYVGQSHNISAVQTSGVLLQGLNRSAVYQLNYKFITEAIPDVYDMDITIANISAQYDPAAIELYARTVRVMPSGVPVDQNPLGEWFDNIMNILANTASFIGGAISAGFTGDPSIGMAIGGGVGNAATWLGNINKRARGDMLRM